MELNDLVRMPNLVTMFLRRADAGGQAPLLWAKRGGRWQSTAWAEVARQVCVLAERLRGLGLEPGDRVMLVSENRPEWCIADLAIMAAGCVTVPAYITNTTLDHRHVVDNTGARAVIVSTAKLAVPLLPAVLQSGAVEHVISMEPLRQDQSGTVRFHEWAGLTEGEGIAERAAVEQRMAGVGRDDLACIIHTSGTGGAPRGVMLHHGSILHNVHGAALILDQDFGLGEEVFLSFLPLSHAYEHTGGQFLPIGVGAQIWYAEGLEKLAGNIEEVRPTVMVVVPRLFEVLRSRIIKEVEKQGRLANGLMERALALGARREAGRTAWYDPALNLLLERVLRPRIRARFGGRVKALVSGGAPLNPDVGLFFQSMGITLLQGYGQTEAGPVISCNRPRAGLKMDTVGPPLADVAVRIADDGEICVAGELIMLGYWRNAAETARTLIHDGDRLWLHTGDIGHIDEAGRIVITDRKKDMIVNDKGDNISPQRVEGMLTLQPEISQVMVVGDRRPYVSALVVPDAEWAVEWAQSQDVPFNVKDLQCSPAFRTAIRAAVDRVNRDLSVIERVRQFAFADQQFTIDNGEMTPSMKIRRHVIRERYKDRLDALYKAD